MTAPPYLRALTMPAARAMRLTPPRPTMRPSPARFDLVDLDYTVAAPRPRPPVEPSGLPAAAPSRPVDAAYDAVRPPPPRATAPPAPRASIVPPAPPSVPSSGPASRGGAPRELPRDAASPSAPPPPPAPPPATRSHADGDGSPHRAMPIGRPPTDVVVRSTEPAPLPAQVWHRAASRDVTPGPVSQPSPLRSTPPEPASVVSPPAPAAQRPAPPPPAIAIPLPVALRPAAPVARAPAPPSRASVVIGTLEVRVTQVPEPPPPPAPQRNAARAAPTPPATPARRPLAFGLGQS